MTPGFKPFTVLWLNLFENFSNLTILIHGIKTRSIRTCAFLYVFFLFSEEIHKSQKAVIADGRYSFICYYLIYKIYAHMLGQTFCLGAFYKFVDLLCMYNCTKYTFGAFNSSLQINLDLLRPT